MQLFNMYFILSTMLIFLIFYSLVLDYEANYNKLYLLLYFSDWRNSAMILFFSPSTLVVIDSYLYIKTLSENIYFFAFQ